MKKLIVIYIFLAGVLISCSNSQKTYLSTLDKSIMLREYYDRQFEEAEDSLLHRVESTDSDSSKWEAVHQLVTMLLYHKLDSCSRYIRMMQSLSGENRRQRQATEVCYVNWLYKVDSLEKAQTLFEAVDTVGLSGETLQIYCDAGYHIYRTISLNESERDRRIRHIMDYWRHNATDDYRYIYYSSEYHRGEVNSQDVIESLSGCPLGSLNDTAIVNYFIGKEYLRRSDTEDAKMHFAIAAECDMRLSAKTYNALYELSKILFRENDIERAIRYIQLTRQDARASNYRTRYENVSEIELEFTNLLISQQRQKETAYIITTIVTTCLLLIVLILLARVSRYSIRLSFSQQKLRETSDIKDVFLATYMEKCVDYLNLTDKYRSSLRHAAKKEGHEAVFAMLRQPSFTDGEFKGLLDNFDSAFLGIFPDFVEKVNEHMQAGHHLTTTSKGGLSTELRILALIRMGIYKRQKIAKILNMSVNSVYSYHCIIRRQSLHPDSSFDEVIASL